MKHGLIQPHELDTNDDSATYTRPGNKYLFLNQLEIIGLRIGRCHEKTFTEVKEEVQEDGARRRARRRPRRGSRVIMRRRARFVTKVTRIFQVEWRWRHRYCLACVGSQCKLSNIDSSKELSRRIRGMAMILPLGAQFPSSYVCVYGDMCAFVVGMVTSYASMVANGQMTRHAMYM